ncbi:MAG: epimerase, partial [Opitutae bacterium]|nr:epimerase [Opitutae bacterium]
MKKIVLAGGSGFLGQALARSVLADGYEVVVLSRGAAPADAIGRFVPWDGKNLGDWERELEGAEALFNLTGRSVDCRYT